MQKLVERRSLSDLVAAGIKQHIVDNRLKPGDRLPTENALADQFGVSRVSVREATKALGFLGILESAPRRGLTVGNVNMTRVTEYLGFHLAINDFPAAQLLESRIIVETGGLPHVMRRMVADPEIYGDLNRLAGEFRQAHDLQTWIELDIAFHRALLESSGLEPLVAFNDLLQVFFIRFRESVKSAQWKRGIESHQRIIDHLRDQKLEEACDELRRHIESHKGQL